VPFSIEQARSAAAKLGNLDAQLAALASMNTPQLIAAYDELYGEPTRSRNRDYLRKRLTWRVQELAEGGLSQSALDKIAALGDQLPERWRRREVVPAPAGPLRDPRLPTQGTVLSRNHRGELHQVVVRERDVEYLGQSFRSLSAVARHITGTAWNGYAFFGLASPRKEQA
jgi:hypothetical protein